MELWVPKVVSLVLLLLLTIIFGLLPIRIVSFLRRREQDDWVYRRRHQIGGNSRARTILSYLNCFSGGVFLSTCLLHLFPDVIEKYNVVMVNITSTNFPIAEAIISGGFFLIMLVEHGVMSLSGGDVPGHSHGYGHSHSYDPDMGHSGAHGQVRITHDSESSPILPEQVPSSSNYGSTLAPPSAHESNTPTSVVVPTSAHEANTPTSVVVPTSTVVPEVKAPHCVDEDPLGDSYASYYHHCDDQGPHHHHPGQTHEQTVQIHSIRSLVLLLALSLHALFEGLALGLESTNDQVWILFAALAIHKSIIAFTMGIQFADTFQQTSRVLCFMLTFALVAPVGIAIGTTITSYDDGSFALDMSSMVLQGLATGTFLYVTFFEVLQKELGVGEHSITKVLVIVLGFVAISLTNLLGG